MNIVIIVVVFGLFVVASGLRIVRQYEQAIVFRLGKYVATRKAGLFWLIPVIDKQTVVDMRTVTASVDKQETITADNVPVQVTVVIWYTIVRAEQSVIAVVNARDSVIQVALTTLRNIIGQHSLDEVLKDQEKLGGLMKDTIDQATEPWGVTVSRVQMRNVELPPSMQRAMAQEAEAVREKKARIIKADAELEAAYKLNEAAEVVMKNPAALELRRMQMITEVGAEQNTTTIVMMPSEFVSAARGLADIGDAFKKGRSSI